MQVEQKTILESTEEYASVFFDQHISDKYTYHNLQHTINVVNAVKEICAQENLTEEVIESLEIAAWFHDMGYDQGAEGHEQRSAEYATKFLTEQGFSKDRIHTICANILATKYPQVPTTLAEKILCDADLNHLGKDTYWDRCGKVRQELALVKDLIMDEQEWIDFELEFMKNHKFHTTVGQTTYEKNKLKHIKLLIKQKARLNPDSLSSDEIVILAKKTEKKKKKNKSKKKVEKKIPLGRGVETMYRTTYRTHVNLSSIADNKANIMLSINAIIVSISVSTLVPKFSDNPKLIAPTLLLLLVCLASIVFATLSTMPKVTEGVFSREDIRQKRSNLLFFGNFYNMKMEDFHWGMQEMIKDSDFLYSSMTRDLYFLGKVLAKKYSYLRTCYRIFMYGLILSVIAFAYVFAA